MLRKLCSVGWCGSRPVRGSARHGWTQREGAPDALHDSGPGRATGIPLTGCSNTADQSAGSSAEEVHSPAAHGDGAWACEVLSPSTRRELEQSSGMFIAYLAVIGLAVTLVIGLRHA
jgi:hypothetical protein